MKLSKLIEGIDVKRRINFRDLNLSGVSMDSRSIKEGELFVAVKGSSVDGHDFVDEASVRGASALIVDREIDSGLPVIIVDDTVPAGSEVARRFYGEPDLKLELIGVTGTNGKTSTAFLLQSILERSVGKTGIIGTVGFGMGGEISESERTTPDPVNLFRIMAGFIDAGCTAAVMEVSSHAMIQGRIHGVEFDAGVFTNITRDHLDYHGTFENYVGAKEMFASTLNEPGRHKKPGILVYNVDDSVVAGIGGRFEGRKVSYGRDPGSDVRAEMIDADLRGTRIGIRTGDGSIDLELKLLGSFSAYNATAAAATASSLGIDLDHIKDGLEAVGSVAGRFQVVGAEGGPVVIVDYAHTPDALENLLSFCRELSPERIITVFGCGGDRDRGKRPIMGRIAADISDRVYITDDNPRTEDPQLIVDEIMSGVRGSDTPCTVIRDRKEAIERSIHEAGDRDLVVIAGKGHETYQVTAVGKVPFSDLAEAEKALGSRGGERPSRLS